MFIDFRVVLPKYHAILDRGLSSGLGNRNGQMCIEAAVCSALGLNHSDDPQCVAKSVRSFKINLNDSKWSSPTARAAGLRRLGVAQLGSKGIVDDLEFAKRIAKKTIQKLLPPLFREIFHDSECISAALRCEQEGTNYAASYAGNAANYAASYAVNAASYAASYAANAASYAANAANNAASYAASYAANAASYAANAANAAYATNTCRRGAKYLILSANLAIEVLTELESPGIEWMDWNENKQKGE